MNDDLIDKLKETEQINLREFDKRNVPCGFFDTLYRGGIELYKALYSLLR